MVDLIKNKKLKRIIVGLSFLIFAVYVLYMINILLFGTYRYTLSYVEYNLFPFKTIWTYIVNYDHYNFNTWFSNLFGNVLAFMPLGFFVPLLFSRFEGLKKVFYLSLFTTLMVEILQIVFRAGAFDVDDIILNTVGGLLGYVSLVVLYRIIAFLGKGKIVSINQVR